MQEMGLSGQSYKRSRMVNDSRVILKAILLVTTTSRSLQL